MHYLCVNLSGRDENLRAFLSAHPAEIQGMSRERGLRTIRILLPDRMRDQLSRYSLTADVLFDETARGLERLKEVGRGNRYARAAERPAVGTVGPGALPLPAQQLMSLDLATTAAQYLNCDEVDSAVLNLASTYPDYCEYIDLPEETFEQRRSRALCIGKKAPGNAPAIMILGGIHGREWGSSEIALNFVDRLLSAHRSQADLSFGGATFVAADIARLLQTRQFVVFPLVNPDGRAYSQAPGKDVDWRKNRNTGQATEGIPNSVGVDINRNFDFLFDVDKGFVAGAGLMVSRDPSDHELYQGPGPFSEVESRNVRSLLDRFPTSQWLIDLHSSSQTLTCPWGDDEVQWTTPAMNFRNIACDRQRGMPLDRYSEYMPRADLDELQRLMGVLHASIKQANQTNFSMKLGFDFCASPGTSHDYAYARHFVDPNLSKVLGFVVEWGREFRPPWVDMQKIIEEVDAGLLGFSLAT